MNIRSWWIREGYKAAAEIKNIHHVGSKCIVPGHSPHKQTFFLLQLASYHDLNAEVKYIIPSNFHSDNNAVFDLYLRQDSECFVFYKKLLGQPKNINKAVSVSFSC